MRWCGHTSFPLAAGYTSFSFYLSLGGVLAGWLAGWCGGVLTFFAWYSRSYLFALPLGIVMCIVMCIVLGFFTFPPIIASLIASLIN